MDSRLKYCENHGKMAEDGFAFVFSHLIKRKSTENENKYKHFDFILKDGHTVDVKSHKKIRPDGYVCLEVINVTGGIGWCHPLSLVDLIAFETKDDWVVVLKQDLIRLLPDEINGTIPRMDRMPIEDKIGVFTGRKSSKYLDENKDVFCYVHIDEIKKYKIEL